MRDVLTIVLGGGRGTRLFPLTHHRSKPAVPLGGKYRLIDIPISNCLHAGLKRIYVLTQFNSASLNRHISQTYRLDLFSEGFVEVLAAEQTPEGERWFQGTADAVRQAARHFQNLDADYYLILAGDHVYRMDFGELIESHIDRGADITIAAQPVAPDEATQMGILKCDPGHQVVGFEEKPTAERLDELLAASPVGPAGSGLGAEQPFVASLGIYVFSREVLPEVLANDRAVDFGKEIIPHALGTHKVQAHFVRGFWADVGTVEAFFDVNLMLTRRGAPFNFFHPTRRIYTRPRFLPASRLHQCSIDEAIVAEGCYLDNCEVRESVVGIRMSIHHGATITRSVLLGADFYDDRQTDTPLGVGRGAVLDRVIVDKNARFGEGVRLVNDRGIQDVDGDGYYIRNGIIIVPKGAVVKAGTVV
jgi:glucose-1-phosphate adenylyltransferase